MGRVIIKFSDEHLESFKCKSKERASEIAGKRPKVKEWNYYDDNERIPQPKKKKVENRPATLEELEVMMKQQGLIQHVSGNEIKTFEPVMSCVVQPERMNGGIKITVGGKTVWEGVQAYPAVEKYNSITEKWLPMNIPDISSSDLIEWLENQKKITTELQAPQGEIEVLGHVIKKVNEMLDNYYKAIVEC